MQHKMVLRGRPIECLRWIICEDIAHRIIERSIHEPRQCKHSIEEHLYWNQDADTIDDVGLWRWKLENEQGEVNEPSEPSIEIDPLDIDDDGDGLSETKETVTMTMQSSILEQKRFMTMSTIIAMVRLIITLSMVMHII